MPNRIEIEGKIVDGEPTDCDMDRHSIRFHVVLSDKSGPPHYAFKGLDVGKDTKVVFGSTVFTGPATIANLQFGMSDGGSLTLEMFPPMKIEENQDADQSEE